MGECRRACRKGAGRRSWHRQRQPGCHDYFNYLWDTRAEMPGASQLYQVAQSSGDSIWNMPVMLPVFHASQRKALLEGNRTFKRWYLMGRFRLSGLWPPRRLRESQLLPLSLFMSCLWGKWSAPAHWPHCNGCSVTGPKQQGQLKLKPPKALSQNVHFSPFVSVYFCFVVEIGLYIN